MPGLCPPTCREFPQIRMIDCRLARRRVNSDLFEREGFAAFVLSEPV
jgi:hypothetical protein